MSDLESRQKLRSAWTAGQLIGRKREMTLLEGLLNALSSNGGAVVLVGGEAGVGKTRLSQELSEVADRQGVSIAWGRQTEGPSINVSGMWINILETLLRAYSPAERRAILGSPDSSISGLLARSSTEQTVPVTSGLSSRDEEVKYIDAISRSVVSISKSKPVMIVLDDLHWADSVAIELFGQIARSANECQLLLITTYRDVELPPTHPLSRMLAVVRRDRHVHHLPIRSLSVSETRKLIQSLATVVEPAAWTEAIWRETSGNPFLTEELVRHLSEAGSLTLSPPKSNIGYDLRSLGIPEGIRQVVNLRMARLSPDAMSLLSSACVSESGFEFDVLREMTGLDDDRLLDALDEVLQAHLVVPQEAKQERYQFVHDIARKAIYSAMSPSRRVRLHRKMADSILKLPSNRIADFVTELAVQYHSSATLPGSEQGIEFALSAARNAEERSSREHVVSLLEIARDLAATESPERQIEVHSRLALAQANSLDLASTGRTVSRLQEFHRQSGVSLSGLAPLLWQIAGALKDGGADGIDWGAYVDLGISLVDREDQLTWARLTLLKERFESVSSGEVNAARWLGIDSTALSIARNIGTEDDFAQTLQPFESFSHASTEALIETILGWTSPSAIIRGLTVTGASWLYHLADFRRARYHFQQLLSVSERYGSIPGQAEAHIRLAIVACALGDLTEAQDETARARELLTRLLPNHRLQTSLGWIDAYLAEYLGGDWKSIASLLTGVVEDPRTGKRSIGLDDAALAALALVRSGQSDAASRMLATLAPLISSIDSTTALANGAVALGASAAWALEAKQVAPVFLVAAEQLIEQGVRSFPCTSLELSAARMATLTSDHSKAAKWFDAARTRLDSEGQRPLRAIVDLDQARVLARRENEDVARAEKLLESARALFLSLGMDEWAAFSYISLPKGRKQEPELPEQRPAGLTRREIEVLRLVSQGHSDRQISAELYLSPRTVNAHIRNMLAKTESSNRTELSVWAMKHLFVGESEPAGE